MIHKEISTAALCAALSVLIIACEPGTSATVVSGDGFGPVRFGMKIEDAERALGVKLQQDTYTDDESCRYFTPAKGFRGLAFMTSKETIVRLDVDEGEDIATDTGVRIGDSEQRVLALYKGRVRVEPHFYTGREGGHYLVVTGNGKVQLVFETDGTKVVSYRAGREP